jgi:uncharacterized protein
VIALDTTVLVYAVGAEHPLREPARSLVEAIGSGALTGTTTVEAIQEFVHVRARRRGRRDAAALGRSFAGLLSPLIELGEDDLRGGLRLFERHERLGAFDAVLAAAVQQRDVTALASADRSFAGVRSLPFVDLATPGLLKRLGADDA